MNATREMRGCTGLRLANGSGPVAERAAVVVSAPGLEDRIGWELSTATGWKTIVATARDRGNVLVITEDRRPYRYGWAQGAWVREPEALDECDGADRLLAASVVPLARRR
jgi:hypothetical protein